MSLTDTANKLAVGLPPVATDGGIPDFLQRTDEVDPNTLEAHPIAMIFPRLDDAAIDQMAFDIKANGQQQPVSLYEGKVLEGVNRTEACKRFKIKVKVRQYVGNDPIGFVLSANLHRRHLDAGQRPMVAAALVKLGVGANQNTEGTSIDVASKLLNVGRASVDRALVVLRSGDAKIIEAAKTGEVAVSKAAEKVKESKTGKGKSKSKGKSKPVTPSSTQLSDDADKYLEKLVEILEEMSAKARVATATDAIRRLMKDFDISIEDIEEEELAAAEEEDEKEAA